MKTTLWLLETCNGEYIAFDHEIDAMVKARQLLDKWGYSENSEDGPEVIKELKDSYKDERYAGFWVDELLWCYQIEYVKG